MSSVSKKALAKERRGGPASRAAPARPELSDEEISQFCNVIGLGPRTMRGAREAITTRYDLGPRGAWIMGLIESGFTSPSALTEVLRIGRSLVTAEINRLQQAGLITGNQSVRDGRRVVLKLTGEGRRASDELRAAVNEFVTGRLAGYSKEQVLACIALLQDFTGAKKFGEERA